MALPALPTAPESETSTKQNVSDVIDMTKVTFTKDHMCIEISDLVGNLISQMIFEAFLPISSYCISSYCFIFLHTSSILFPSCSLLVPFLFLSLYPSVPEVCLPRCPTLPYRRYITDLAYTLLPYLVAVAQAPQAPQASRAVLFKEVPISAWAHGPILMKIALPRTEQILNTCNS